MSTMSNVVALVPARGGSKGIPRKNIQDVCGKPLVGHTIEQALACDRITRVIMNSEDKEIRAVGEEYGAEVMDRPEKFHYDNTFQEVDRLLMWCVEELEKEETVVDVVVLLYPTAPLRRVRHIDRCVELVTEEGFDSALTLVEDTSYLWKVNEDATASPTNYDPKTRGPRQKENWNQWAENKAVYAMRRDLLMTTGCRLGGRIGLVEMAKVESIDVDTPDDLELVRVLMAKRQADRSG